MALVKKPKAALARHLAKTKRRVTPRNRKKPVEVAEVAIQSPLDRLVTGGTRMKRGTVEGHVEIEPHGLTGSIPLGERSPRYDEPIQVLQAAEDFGGANDAEKLVARMLIREFRSRNRIRSQGDDWFAWIGTVSYQRAGLIFWIGLSSNIPADVFDGLDDLIRAMGFATARATAIPAKHGLAPLLYLGDDGLELLRMF